MLPNLEWSDYLSDGFSLVDFPAGSVVLDIGCGAGRLLRDLAARGCVTAGIESDQALVRTLKSQGFNVKLGVAEDLPVRSGEVDGIVCNVVIPYTDEYRAVREWARVLRSGGEVRATCHGAGYYLRYFIVGPHWKRRVYGMRAIVNTWFYVFTGRRLPGWMGDTIYQSSRRLRKYYNRFGLEVVEAPHPRTYLGQPVFIAHHLIKRR